MAGRVRQPIDIKALEAWVANVVPEIEAPLDLKQFGFGQSNPTYLITAATGARYVLRKKPPGTLVSRTAHQVEREYRIIAALGRSTDVPVPRAYCLCEDDAVIGTPFYIMSYLDGRIFEDPVIPNVLPDERRAIWGDAVRVLARLHRVSPASVGLRDFGRPAGFYARQVRTWSAICEAQAAVKDVESGEPVGQLPRFDDMMGFFGDERHQPVDRGTLVHGDFKIDNLVFHKTEPRVIGILDWEMSTIGHPLSDLSNLLTPYFTARLDPARSISVHHGFLPRATRGLPTPEEITSLYFSVVDPGEKSALELSLKSSAAAAAGGGGDQDRARELQWAQAFNIFRLSAICQGIAARYAGRQASSEKARKYGESRDPLARFAWELVKAVREPSGGRGAGRRGYDLC
ncbi:kinase-like domain-containing protein [Bombardia bombarda]|uniref:Kinase-like domain-containing protein n=1 Tax=Bombardia bombarda TaxID=252184 RepID=A0AA39T2M2_9PEZI|nr:kinase-like domain-containing protein [Bombardia bombarda]